MGARRRAGARWSATFIVKADHGGETRDVDAGVSVDDGALRWQLRDASTVTFRWRYDGHSRSRKLSLPAGETDALEFRRTRPPDLARRVTVVAAGLVSRPVECCKGHNRTGSRVGDSPR